MRARSVFEFAVNKNSKYYAPESLVQELVSAVKRIVPLEEIDHIVEPAAGDGALIPFIDNIANTFNIDVSYYDLFPDAGSDPRIEKQDFLDYFPDPYFSESRLIITGPPYGKPGATAKIWKQFAQKASEVAGYVAFISPVTWLDVLNPVPYLERIYQKNVGVIEFRGSEADGGEPRKVKTAILIYKTIREPQKEDFSSIESDFLIQEIRRDDNFKNRKYDYYILSWGRDSGRVNTTGKYPDGLLFSKAIGIRVLNEARRGDLEEFLETFEEEYKDKIARYSITSANVLSVPRFKRFLQEALYSGINESQNFQRGPDPRVSIGIGRGVTPEWWEENREIYLGMEKLAKEHNLKLDIKEIIPEGKVTSIRTTLDFNKIPIDIVLYYGKPYRNSDRPLFQPRVYQYSSSWGLGFWDTLESALKEIERYIKEETVINESQNFQRGADPKKALGIGMRERILREMYDDDFPAGEDEKPDQTALIWAAYTRREQYVDWLLANSDELVKSPPKEEERRGDPVLMALRGNNIDILKKLLDNGFRPHDRLLDILVHRIGIEVQSRDTDDQSLLKILKILLEKGAFKKSKVHKRLEKTISDVEYIYRTDAILDAIEAMSDYVGVKAPENLRESQEFIRGGDPRKTIGIGGLRPYPKMSPKEFLQWFAREIEPRLERYVGIDNDFFIIEDNILGNTWESDDALSRFCIARGMSPDLLKDLLPARDYFNDVQYSSPLQKEYKRFRYDL